MAKNKCFLGVCGANSQVKRHSLLTGMLAAANVEKGAVKAADILRRQPTLSNVKL